MSKYALVTNRHSKFFGLTGKILNTKKNFGINLVELEIKIKAGELIFLSSITYPEDELMIDDSEEKLKTKSKIYFTFK